MPEQTIPQIFLSYANPDQDRIKPFFEALERDGFNVWMDCFRLKPGQNWEFEIKRALDKSTLVIVFLSNQSVNRRGYVQKELKGALDKLSEKLVDDIYLIPVLLDDDTSIPEQVKGIHCIRASTPDFLTQIGDALTHQIGRLGLDVNRIQKKQEFSWVSRTRKEAWDGLPGYEVELQVLDFSSTRYPAVSEMGDLIKGDLLRNLFGYRAVKLDQLPEVFNYGQDKFRRTNTLDAHCREPMVKGNVVTTQYAIHWFGAGAAHPNFHFRTYSFVLDPLIYISSLQDIFIDATLGLKALQETVRKQLSEVRVGDDDEPSLEVDQIKAGTENWENFSAFVFGEAAVELLFAPYQVAGYALGAQFAEVPYLDLVEYIKPDYASALQIEHLSYRKKHGLT